MVWRHRGVDITPQDYHSVPTGWHADEIFSSHKLMRGAYPISDFKIGRWGAPSWTTERYEWLRYKETLNRVAAGIRAGDEACNEIGVRYLELRFIGSYSGFIRAKLARALRSSRLTGGKQDRLNEHFLKVVIERDYTEEFREHRKLWGLIVTKNILNQVVSHFRQRPDEHEPEWLSGLVAACDSNVQIKPSRVGGKRRIPGG